MTEVNRILDQLSRAFEGEAWHGPAVLEILRETTARRRRRGRSTAPIQFGKQHFTFRRGCGRAVEDWKEIARN